MWESRLALTIRIIAPTPPRLVDPRMVPMGMAEDLGDDFSVGMMAHAVANARAEQRRGQHRFMPEGVNVPLLTRIDGLRPRSGVIEFGANGIHPGPDKASSSEANSLDQPRMPKFHVGDSSDSESLVRGPEIFWLTDQ